MTVETITYYYRGPIERVTSKRGYQWYDGYSEQSSDGGVLYPWITKKEARVEAAKLGCKAVFVQEQQDGKPQEME